MRTVFVDVDTQFDFLMPAGALYIPGAERLIPVIAQLNQFAAAHSMPLISTTDAHDEDDAEFRDWPPHCVAGTTGQLKAPETLLERRCTLRVKAGVPIELTAQIIAEKKTLEIFSNPNFAPLLSRLAADRYVIYGVATDYCVRRAALGLLHTGKPVSIVRDAIAAVKAEDGARGLDEFTTQGGTLTTVSDVCA